MITVNVEFISNIKKELLHDKKKLHYNKKKTSWLHLKFVRSWTHTKNRHWTLQGAKNSVFQYFDDCIYKRGERVDVKVKGGIEYQSLYWKGVLTGGRKMQT